MTTKPLITVAALSLFAAIVLAVPVPAAPTKKASPPPHGQRRLLRPTTAMSTSPTAPFSAAII